MYYIFKKSKQLLQIRIKLRHWYRRCEIKLFLKIEARFILGLTFEKKILKIYCCCSPFYFHALFKRWLGLCLKSYGENCLDMMQDKKVEVNVPFLTQFPPQFDFLLY